MMTIVVKTGYSSSEVLSLPEPEELAFKVTQVYSEIRDNSYGAIKINRGKIQRSRYEYSCGNIRCF